MTHLFDRICWAADHLVPVQTDYVIVYEDTPDDPARIVVPAPEWLAMALAGGLLPPVSHYHDEPRDVVGNFIGPRDYWSDYEPLPPLTVREAMEYLLQKDVPRHVWAEGSNHRYCICTRDQIPKSRQFRNAWRVAA